MQILTRRRWLTSLCVLTAVGVASASVALADRDDGKAAELAPGCTPTNPQPTQPLEMNTVVIGNVAKTIAMEKELFDCQDDATGSTFARDVETFVEIIETGSSTNVTTSARRVLVATCDKNFVPTGRVSCRWKSVPLPTTVVSTPLAGCRQFPADSVVKTPADPVEMNSVVLGDFVKTIKLEKEVLNCQGFIGEVYLFTEVLERRTSSSPIPATFATRFEGIMCRKDPVQGEITGCTRFSTT